MTDIPHFSFPFRWKEHAEATPLPGPAPRTLTIPAFGTMAAAVNEQDSREEIADCVHAVLLFPLGHRVELPEFGVRDMAFEGVIDKEEVERVISQWEPRADATVEVQPIELDNYIARAMIELGADDA